MMATPAQQLPGRVLVVDDNEANRDILSRRLRRHGHTVTVAAGGREALEMLRANDVDVVLLDIMMPEVNGFAVLEQAKADAALRDVPIIMISAADDVAGVVRCIELGAEDYLPKPCEPVILKARVDATLEKKRLRDRERMHARALERELDIGREIQRGFLPQALPMLHGWELAVRFEPARQVSGDFYDAFLLGDGTRLGVVVGDVCDKGVGAALFMAIFRTLIRSTSAWIGATGPDDDAAQCLHRVIRMTNDYIAVTHSQANMFATVFFGILDPRTGHLDYINAGHEPPIIAGGGMLRGRLLPTGPAVGLLPDASFVVGVASLRVGDALVVFTDGATESRAPNGLLLGDDVLAAACGAESSSAEALLTRVMSVVSAHAAGAEQSDDIAMLALRRGDPVTA